MKKLNRFFETKTAYGVLFLRLVIGWRLIAGVWDHAIGSKPIAGVSDFFTQLHLPVPGISAVISVYSQFVCGILFILGWWTRPAAMLMIINFSIAIIAAHTNDPIERSFVESITKYNVFACSGMNVFILFRRGFLWVLLGFNIYNDIFVPFMYGNFSLVDMKYIFIW